MEMLHGTWKANGYVFAVPVAKRARIQVVRVTGAEARVVKRDPSVFYVIIPGALADADEWRVGITENGALRVMPPETPEEKEERIGGSGRRGHRGAGSVQNVIGAGSNVTGTVIQAGLIRGGVNLRGGGQSQPQGRGPSEPALPTIGLALPRDIPVYDRL